jgi:hypothetical protein
MRRVRKYYTYVWYCYYITNKVSSQKSCNSLEFVLLRMISQPFDVKMTSFRVDGDDDESDGWWYFQWSDQFWSHWRNEQLETLTVISGQNVPSYWLSLQVIERLEEEIKCVSHSICKYTLLECTAGTGGSGGWMDGNDWINIFWPFWSSFHSFAFRYLGMRHKQVNDEGGR